MDHVTIPLENVLVIITGKDKIAQKHIKLAQITVVIMGIVMMENVFVP
jgi:uncharacterized membrane protein YwaF